MASTHGRYDFKNVLGAYQDISRETSRGITPASSGAYGMQNLNFFR
jgi:hypothetical protein